MIKKVKAKTKIQLHEQSLVSWCASTSRASSLKLECTELQIKPPNPEMFGMRNKVGDLIKAFSSSLIMQLFGL